MPVEDDNPCTDGACTSGGEIIQAPLDGVPCATNGDSTANGTCQAGVCIAGSTTACKDDDDCIKSDACSPELTCDVTTGKCTPVAGTGVTCEDTGDPCVIPTCNPVSGLCLPLPAESATCSDGNACTIGDQCIGTTCQSSGVISVDDGVDCTLDLCDPVSGQVTHVPEHPKCEGGGPCSIPTCTLTGCSHLPANAGTACDDDALECTIEQCDDEGECVAAVSSGMCLTAGACWTAGEPGPDGPCTMCDPNTDQYGFTATVDGVDCGTCGACFEGTCVPDLDAHEDCGACRRCIAVGECGPQAVEEDLKGECPDGGGCRPGFCDGAGACAPAAQDGLPCLLATTAPCSTFGDACQAGVCVAGAVPFATTFGGDDDDAGTDVLEVPSDGFVIAARSQSTASGGECLLTRLGEDGAEVWSTMYGGPGDQDCESVLLAAGGGFLIVGGTSTIGGDGWARRVDSMGAEVWSAQYGDSGSQWLYDAVADPDGGYLLAGRSANGGGNDAWVVSVDDAGDVRWQRTYGGTGDDQATSIIAVRVGYLIVGTTSTNGAGGRDGWISRLDDQGSVLWSRTFGGAGDDDFADAIATGDGFVLAGQRHDSTDLQGWLVRTSATGEKLWEISRGGPGSDRLLGVTSLPSGTLIAAGSSRQVNTADDAWLVAVSKAGTFLWERQFGESLDDEAASITTVTSGGVAVTGAWHAEATSGTDVWMSRLDDWGHASCETSGVCAALPDDSCDDQNACTWDGCDAGAGCYHAVASDGVPCNAGSCTVGDVCEGGECTSGGAPSLYERAFGAGANDHGAGIVERAGGGFAVAGISAGSSMMVLTDASGNAVDTRVFNAGNYSGLDAIVNMPDGGFAMVGVTEAGGFGLRDYRIIKATASGSVVWDKAFGGNSYDNAFDIVALPDGGVAVIGASSSFKSDGPNDFWVVRTTSGGGTMWNRSYAAGGDEYGTGLTAIGTDGFALTGFTTGKGAGGHDAWLVRTTPDGERIWDATYGGPGDDSANKVGLLPDGGFVLVGQTKSQGAGEYDLWVVRTSATGTALWEKVLGKSGPDHGHDVLPMADGRIVVVGSTREIAGDDQGWLVVLDGDGNLEWEREYGGGGNDSLRSIVGSSDGFAVAGETTSIGAGLVDAWLLRVDSWGHASCQEAGLCASTPFPECEPDGACSLASCSPQTGCTTEPRDGERWRTAKSLPAPRFGMATVATTGRIYSLGGSANGLTQASEVLMADIVEDGLLGDWKATTPLPHARQELEAVVVGQRVFAIAGGDKYGQYATVDSAPILADGSLGSWTSCPDLPEPRTSFAAVADESRIYALGGNANNKNTASVVMASVGGDGTLSTWTSVTSLPHALTSHGAVIAGGHIHVLGGGDGSYRGTAISSPILPDGSLGAWSTTGDPGTQMNSMAVVASARIWLLGGDEPLEPAVRWSDASDILTQWAVASPQPLASADGGAVEWNHRVYVVGGRTASGATSSVHVMDACPN